LQEQGSLNDQGGQTKRTANIISIFASPVTWWRVVADGVWNVGDGLGVVRVDQGAAELGEASDFGSLLPHDLAEVTPRLEVSRACDTVETGIFGHLGVVHEVGDERGKFDAIADVLTIASTVDVSVVSVSAGLGQNAGAVLKSGVVN
jgi:hypothetical protein